MPANKNRNSLVENRSVLAEKSNHFPMFCTELKSNYNGNISDNALN